MTQLKFRAVWSLIIWSLVMIGICVVFFSAGGADTFLDGERRVTLTRVFITLGFSAYFLLLFLTRRRRGTSAPVKDERDEMIQKQALTAGFYVVIAYAFLFSIAMYAFYKVYSEMVLMPVGWVWFLGLSCIILGHITIAASTLILNGRMSGNGKR